jgi:hypothetical protein
MIMSSPLEVVGARLSAIEKVDDTLRPIAGWLRSELWYRVKHERHYGTALRSAAQRAAKSLDGVLDGVV